MFPVGLILCLLLGGTLFTGNCLLFVNYLKKDITLKQIWKNLSITWVGNFIGGAGVALISYLAGMFDPITMQNTVVNIATGKLALSFSKCIFSGFLCNILVIAALISYLAGMFDPITMQNTVVNIATGKLALSFSKCIFSGFLCNILVIAGIWLSTSSKDSAGKFYGCWFPIMLFVISGYQHVVANMFIITMAKLVSPESINFLGSFVSHFLPVTIGNFLSGGIVFIFYQEE